MTIPVECPSCHLSFQVDAAHAGKRARCRRCQTVFRVPAPAAMPDDPGLVPLDEEPDRPGRLERASTLERSPSSGPEDDDTPGYALAGGGPRRVKPVKVRSEALTGAGAGAKGVADAAAPTRRTLTPKQVLASLEGTIEPVRATFLYRLWIAIVAGVMVLLPLVYLAIVGLFAILVVYHAVNNVTILQTVGKGAGAAKFALFVYVAPLLAGVGVLGFMLKPLFARRQRGPENRVLDPEVEPLLYAFVDGICDTVGAPRPARIAVDSQVNASAHLEGVLWGVLGGELVLTIGLPIAAGLTLKQFAGVLAHEFGHFSQRVGMRLYVLINMVNLWFARVVYERDSWDEALEGWSKQGNFYVIVLAAAIRVTVWITRRVLWVLMMFGHVVSGFLSRQMEFDADRYHARMVGAREFGQTQLRVRMMALAEQGAYADLSTSWQERRMPDNFPKLVLANLPQIPKDLVKKYREEMQAANTGFLDTHPCDRDRRARAEIEEPGEGIFALDAPATDVFRNFDLLARAVSFDMYRAVLGPEITKEQLYTVAELVEHQTVAQEGFEAGDRFFLGALNVNQRLPLPWDYPKLPDDPAAAKQALVQAREGLRAALPNQVEAAQRALKTRNQLHLAELALIYLKNKLPIEAAPFELKAATARSAEGARDRALRELLELEGISEPFAAAAAARLTHALGILQADPVADRVKSGRERREEARALYLCAAHLGASVVGPLARVAHHRMVLMGVVQAIEASKDQQNELLLNALSLAAAKLHEMLEEFRWKVGDTIYYPFEHAQEDITLARFALPEILPERNDVVGLLNVSAEAIERLSVLYVRVLGRLAVTAEEVERALGLPPISPPPSEPSEPRATRSRTSSAMS
ncbi:MAG: M48 family metalloprotease [Isosphaeraceae bacterium]